MAEEREIACIYYKCEGDCEKGKKGLFRKTCQICKNYKPRKGGVPARKNLKKQKLEKIKKQDIKTQLNEDC